MGLTCRGEDVGELGVGSIEGGFEELGAASITNPLGR